MFLSGQNGLDYDSIGSTMENYNHENVALSLKFKIRLLKNLKPIWLLSNTFKTAYKLAGILKTPN